MATPLPASIPLYDNANKIVCTLTTRRAVQLEGVCLNLVRTRKNKVKRAYITAAPGFLRHIIEDMIGPNAELGFKPCDANFGVCKRQELPSGHVIFALRGVRGSE